MTTALETQLPLFAKPQVRPGDEAQRDVRRTLKQFADLGKRWISGKELAETIGWGDTEASRRKLRGVAEQSRGQILSGNDGYCLLSRATIDEVHHAAARLRSQGRKMLARSIRIERAFHQSQNNS